MVLIAEPYWHINYRKEYNISGVVSPTANLLVPKLICCTTAIQDRSRGTCGEGYPANISKATVNSRSSRWMLEAKSWRRHPIQPIPSMG